MAKVIKKPGTSRKPQTAVAYSREVAVPDLHKEPIKVQWVISNDPEINTQDIFDDYATALRISRQLNASSNTNDRFVKFFQGLGQTLEESVNSADIAKGAFENELQYAALMIAMLDHIFYEKIEDSGAKKIELRTGFTQVEIPEEYWSLEKINRRRSRSELPPLQMNKRSPAEQKIALINVLYAEFPAFREGMNDVGRDVAALIMNGKMVGSATETDDKGFQSGGLDSDSPGTIIPIGQAQEPEDSSAD